MWASLPRHPEDAEPWLPHQRRWRETIVLGGVVGILGSYLTWLTGSAFLAFGISAFSLVFLCCGVSEIPVTYHITLPASTAVIAAAGNTGATPVASLSTTVPLGEAMLIGAFAGIIGSMLAEVGQRIFYIHAETHFDPPAASIMVSTFLIGLAGWGGIFPGTAWLPVS